MVKALVFGTRDWEFESSRDRLFIFLYTVIPLYTINTITPIPYPCFLVKSSAFAVGSKNRFFVWLGRVGGI